MKREKFSIWGREPDTKKGCKAFYQSRKETWPIGHSLNEEDKKYMLEMMDKNYYSPIKSQWVQDVFKSVKDKIIEINIDRHPVFTADKLIKFWVKKPVMNKNGLFIDDLGEVYTFSVARCICFGGKGMTNESDLPRPAVLRALRSAFADDKIEWKRAQGYKAGIDDMKHAHHVDGKEVKTILVKFFNAIKKSEDEFVNAVYPEHGNFETNHIYYEDIMGWRFKDTEKGLKFKDAFSKFHYRNREYELIDPIHHQNITSEETKFNTSIKKEIQELIK